jgi:hypothetical protein
LRGSSGWDKVKAMTAEEKFLKAAIRNGLRMQHRFAAEPVLATTGKGYLKSEGTDTLRRIKDNVRKKKAAAGQA